MRIAVGSDHAGYALKTRIADHLAAAGHDVLDLGTDTADVPVDYPLYGHAVGVSVASGQAERGVCVCGTGMGIGIAANKVPGIRAAVAHDSTTAVLARRHNDANVLCLGERTTGPAEAIDAVDAFFTTGFDGGRHQRRIDLIAGYDADNAGRAGAAPTDHLERQQPTP
ncbi:MAG: ribose 5-phosphate isomerase B [Acidimicrobiales bacterium]|jgi:ribose 5-phosphate isomerase B